MFIAYWSHSSHLKGTFIIFSICRMIALGPTSITLVMYQNVCLYIWIKNSLNVYNMYYIHGKSEIIPENIHFCCTEYAKALTVWITTNCGKFLKRWEYQTTLLASWEICIQVKKPVRIGHGTMDFFQVGKGVCQGCILSPCLFNSYAEYIVWNARLDEAQAGIKIARRNIHNLRYADDTTLMAESEEELKSLLMKVKEESEKLA